MVAFLTLVSLLGTAQSRQQIRASLLKHTVTDVYKTKSQRLQVASSKGRQCFSIRRFPQRCGVAGFGRTGTHQAVQCREEVVQIRSGIPRHFLVILKFCLLMIYTKERDLVMQSDIWDLNDEWAGG